MKTKFYLLSLFLVMFSCQQESVEVLELDDLTNLSTLTTDSSFVDLEMAKLVAITPDKHSSRSAADAAGDVFTIKDKDNLPALYVVNNANNQGYSIVSATKNYHPILAWTDEGYLNPETAPETVEFYINGFRNNVEVLRNAPYDSIYQYRQEWVQYEERENKRLESRSLPTATQQFIENKIAEWTNAGYEVAPIATNSLGLSEADYQNALIRAEMSMRDDYMETSFILRKIGDVKTNSYIPIMLTTKWGQEYPYYEYVNNYYYDVIKIGCSVVAASQIMKYHQKPQNFSWSTMPSVAIATDYMTVAQMMFNVGKDIRSDYFTTGSGASINEVKAYLNSVGYNNARVVAHNESIVQAQLKAYRPVYMRGTNSISTTNSVHDNHAWVCDGLQDYTTRTVYYLMTLNYQEPLLYNSTELLSEGEYATKYYHMNWGLDGNCNGWFRDTNLSIVYYGDNLNLVLDRKDIIDIY